MRSPPCPVEPGRPRDSAESRPRAHAVLIVRRSQPRNHAVRKRRKRRGGTKPAAGAETASGEMAAARPEWRETGAGRGNRTLVFSLEGCCSTIELYPPAAEICRVPGVLARTSSQVSARRIGGRTDFSVRPAGTFRRLPRMRAVPRADLARDHQRADSGGEKRLDVTALCRRRSRVVIDHLGFAG